MAKRARRTKVEGAVAASVADLPFPLARSVENPTFLVKYKSDADWLSNIE